MCLAICIIQELSTTEAIQSKQKGKSVIGYLVMGNANTW